MQKDRLITPSYCFILAANFLLYFGFYLLMPVFPFYLVETFSTPSSSVGVILACYTVAALTIRPFSGYLLDTFARKPLYLLAFSIFTCIFGGYILAGSVMIFTILRIIHGFAFGTVTVAGNTIVIDIMPSSRRGEGLGYYGLSNNIAMSLGPMTGLFLHDYYSFDFIFLCAMGCCILGMIMAVMVKAPKKEPVKHDTPVSLDRFILLKGIPLGVALLLLSIPYGMTTTYVAMYAKDIGIANGTGLFFSFMAVGMAVSRLFSGKQVDRGRITEAICIGLYVVIICFALLFACEWMMSFNASLTKTVFFSTALLLGAGFGTMFPAFNTMFVNLAPNSQRGTATSTYLTSWDVGIGLGLVAGGLIRDIDSLSHAYLFGAFLSLVSMIYFRYYVAPHFHRNRMR